MCQHLENLYHLVNQYFPVINVWCYKIMHRSCIQNNDRPMDFRKVNTISDYTVQLTFKKLVKF